MLTNTTVYVETPSQRCTEQGKSPQEFCSGKGDCYTKGEVACTADPSCHGFMWASSWYHGTRVQYCSNVVMSDHDDWTTWVEQSSWASLNSLLQSVVFAVPNPDEFKVGTYLFTDLKVQLSHIRLSKLATSDIVSALFVVFPTFFFAIHSRALPAQELT